MSDKTNTPFTAILSSHKMIFVIIGICIAVAGGGVFGYMYFEDQQKQLQNKLDTEQKKKNNN
ncbi:MAG: hypothetical protein KGI27_06070 [Thaumarchaeota archaeon]|nr:hypothetical protein [Nitrososphaerota archaeon]